MKQREPVSHIMTKELHKLNLTDGLFKAKELFEKHNLRHLPVVNGEGLAGIISLTDILRISFGSNFGDDQKGVDTAIYEMLSVDQVMKHNPHTVSSVTPIKEVAEILSREEFHALPVVDQDQLVGIVTTTDVIKYLINQY